MGNDDEMEFKDEKSIRGAKSIADKADMAYVMTRVSPKGWQSVKTTLDKAAQSGYITADKIAKQPTHVLDIYKMRRGRYKMVRIWCNIHLGTGEREDLFMTTADNQPISDPIDLFSSVSEQIITIKKEGE